MNFKNFKYTDFENVFLEKFPSYVGQYIGDGFDFLHECCVANMRLISYRVEKWCGECYEPVKSPLIDVSVVYSWFMALGASEDTMELILSNLAKVYVRLLESEVDEIIDPVSYVPLNEEFIKANVLPLLFNSENCDDFRVCTRWNDLAVVYYVKRGGVNSPERKLPQNTIFLTKECCEGLGIDDSMLFEWAYSNLEKVEGLRARMLSVGEVIPEDLLEKEIGDAKDVSLHMISNNDCVFGATCLLSVEALRLLGTLSDRYGCDLCIMPSSVHECMVSPVYDDSADFWRTNRAMVVSVNEELEPGLWLSDNVYRYSRERNCISMESVL